MRQLYVTQKSINVTCWKNNWTDIFFNLKILAICRFNQKEEQIGNLAKKNKLVIWP